MDRHTIDVLFGTLRKPVITLKRDKVLYKFINKMECVTNSVSTDRLVYDWLLKRSVFVVLSHFLTQCFCRIISLSIL